MNLDERINAIQHLNCPGHAIPNPSHQCEDDIKRLIADCIKEVVPERREVKLPKFAPGLRTTSKLIEDMWHNLALDQIEANTKQLLGDTNG